MKKILPFFSYLFHPIFIPVMATLFYLLHNPIVFSTEEKIYVLIQVGIISLIVPALLFMILRSFGKIDSIMIADVSQRIIPLIMQCFLLILLVRKSITLDRYPELHFFFVAALLSTILALIGAFFGIKASLHMLAISALTVFIFAVSLHFQLQNNILIALLFLTNGLVAASRLEMNAHTYKELVLGFFIGGIPQLLLLLLWL